MQRPMQPGDACAVVQEIFPYLPASNISSKPRATVNDSWEVTVSFGSAGEIKIRCCCPSCGAPATGDGRKLFGATDPALEPLLRTPGLPPSIPGELVRTIQSFDGPRGFDELRRFLELCRDVLEAATLRLMQQTATRYIPIMGETDNAARDVEVLAADMERRLVKQAFARTSGDCAAAARLLGISERSLRSRLDKYRIQTD